ncbi:MAG: glycosyltransferase [Methylococcales bacterium]|nr:glycosyltransferase [Methylococcales bacterium]MDD5630714.1 glycosyltransferase [Methylococcales bacterium]
MNENGTKTIRASLDPFLQSDFLILLERLELRARQKAAALGFNWKASLKNSKHTLAKQAITILKLGLFDESYYLATYPDVLASNINPLLHYVSFGDLEGRWPNPIFSPNFYRSQFGESGLHSVCTLYHYAVMGEAIGLKASEIFDPNRYLVSNMGLQPWLDRPMTHFLHMGRHIGLAMNQKTRLEANQKVRFERAIPQHSIHAVKLSHGINVIGPLDKVSGLGVSARGYYNGLKKTGLAPIGSRVQQREFAIQKSIENKLAFPEYISDASVNIYHMNGDTLPLMLHDGGDALFHNKYNIAIWYWELPTLRPEWQASMKYFDEFWAPTPFIARALRQSTAKPVKLVPPYLSYLSILKRTQRTSIELSHFVYCFDANSILERKNPGALLEAFLQAFPSDNNVQITFKITYPNRNIPEVDRLYLAGSKDSRIKVIDTLMSDEDLHALIGSGTAYVSPHRSEGLGLTVIEAMAAGIPVVATPFGGVEQFVTFDAAYPIDYRLVELEDNYVPYPKGYIWADPDVDSIACALHKVHHNKEQALIRAAVAQKRVLDFFAAPSVIEDYKAELRRLT